MPLPTWAFVYAGIWLLVDVLMLMYYTRRATRDGRVIKELEFELKRMRGY